MTSHEARRDPMRATADDDLQAMVDTTVAVTHTEDFDPYGPVRHTELIHVTTPITNNAKES